MTRYSELYRNEQEAHDLTAGYLMRIKEELQLLRLFIREEELSETFAAWCLERRPSVEQ